MTTSLCYGCTSYSMTVSFISYLILIVSYCNGHHILLSAPWYSMCCSFLFNDILNVSHACSMISYVRPHIICLLHGIIWATAFYSMLWTIYCMLASWFPCHRQYIIFECHDIISVWAYVLWEEHCNLLNHIMLCECCLLSYASPLYILAASMHYIPSANDERTSPACVYSCSQKFGTHNLRGRFSY